MSQIHIDQKFYLSSSLWSCQVVLLFDRCSTSPCISPPKTWYSPYRRCLQHLANPSLTMLKLLKAGKSRKPPKSLPTRSMSSVLH